ncbi:UPF0489 family protein [Candidatus Gracilibacteria bacterium]|nr:UPF0489 family protein [Candidatus Gracilibacteria bacterium]
MYSKPFYITENIGNNAFSFDKRDNKQLYVPSIKKISSLDDIEFGDEVVFEDYNIYKDTQLDSCKGIKNFYEFDWEGKKIYLFDNHNHAYFFWYLARDKGYIKDNAKLYHIDEHSDMRDVDEYLVKPESLDIDKIFQATNFSNINVGNYILPAQKEGIIGEIVQIRNEDNLKEYQDTHMKMRENNIILNLDLDFYQPDLDFIDYELKKQVTLDAARKADVITVATSPFFIEQGLAIKVFKDLFQ